VHDGHPKLWALLIRDRCSNVPVCHKHVKRDQQIVVAVCMQSPFRGGCLLSFDCSWLWTGRCAIGISMCDVINGWPSLDDFQIEEMCDDERYRSLTIMEEQDSRDNDDEEEKRTKSNAFGFDYNRYCPTPIFDGSYLICMTLILMYDTLSFTLYARMLIRFLKFNIADRSTNIYFLLFLHSNL